MNIHKKSQKISEKIPKIQEFLRKSLKTHKNPKKSEEAQKVGKL